MVLCLTKLHFFCTQPPCSHTFRLASRHSASSQLCIDMIQIEHLSTAQVTHIHATALYKDHYIRSHTFTLLHYIKTII